METSNRASPPRGASRSTVRAAILAARVLVALASFPVAHPAAAQEFTLFGGKSTAPDLSESTYAWKLEYRQGLGEHVAFTYSWMNEGHVTGHHRDGHTFQLWARQTTSGRRLSFGLGAGAYRYYDTAEGTAPGEYVNVHGWAVLASGDVTAYLGKRWLARLQANRTWADSESVDTWNFVLGLGYQLTAPEGTGPRPEAARQPEPTARNEVTLFAGQTVVNSFDSPNSVAASFEYRRTLGRYVDVSAAYLYEGDARLVRRGGIIVQAWFGRAFFDERLALGFGAGVYVAVDERKDAESGDTGGTVAAMVTPSVSYRFARHWHARFSWNRTATTYDRDTDVFQVGLGYRF